jgi:hypothetical protein
MSTTTAPEHAAMEAAGMDDQELAAAVADVTTEYHLRRAAADEIETRNQARFQESLTRRTR